MRREPGSTVARKVVRVPAAIGVLVALALLCASCGGGTPHAAGKAHQAVAQHVRTSPATVSPQSSTTTTTTAPAVKTSPNTFVPTTHPAPPPPAPTTTTTTTTTPFPPACGWSNFATTVSTDQSTYSSGQAVHITLVFANRGPACTANASGYGCPDVDVDNSSGTLVWSNAAPVTTGCPSLYGPTVVPATWSQTWTYSWAQVTCTPGDAQGCPGPQVPAGQYQVIGTDSGGASQIPASQPVAITLTP